MVLRDRRKTRRGNKNEDLNRSPLLTEITPIIGTVGDYQTLLTIGSRVSVRVFSFLFISFLFFSVSSVPLLWFPFCSELLCCNVVGENDKREPSLEEGRENLE